MPQALRASKGSDVPFNFVTLLVLTLSFHPSMSYQVLARKWRPQQFDDVIGQPAVTRTLKNAITSGASRRRSCLPGRAAWARPPPRAFWRAR